MLTATDCKKTSNPPSWTGINFINILLMRFLYKSTSGSFSLFTFWRKHSFVILGAKILYEKQALKMLMKLTAGINFTNVLLAAFAPVDLR